MNKTTREDEEKKETISQNVPAPEKTVSEKTVKIRPTLTEIAIAKNLLAGASQTDALYAAGYAYSTARYHSTEIINRPGVQMALAEALKRAGGIKDKVARVMVAGLDATRQTHSGDTVIDFQERRKSAEQVATFAGWKPATQLDMAPGESYHDRILRLNAELGDKVIDSYADEDAID